MKVMLDGRELSGPRGPAGPDGNPIGTVLSFLGTKAPADYLACDGAAYRVADYPALAAFFQEQFGSAGYFGGDGESTFAVPDLRNLFLRGYHGEAAERLSGEVGQRQEGTEFPSTRSDGLNKNFAMYAAESNIANHVDSFAGEETFAKFTAFTQRTEEDLLRPYYTARPVNMAVLYCVKAV